MLNKIPIKSAVKKLMALLSTMRSKSIYYEKNLRYINNHLHQAASTEVRIMQKDVANAEADELSNIIFACALHKIRPNANLLPQWQKQWQKSQFPPSQNSLSKIMAAYCELGLLESLEQRSFCLKALNVYLSNVNGENGIGTKHNIIAVFKCINMMLNVYDVPITEIIINDTAHNGLSEMVQTCHLNITKILSKTNGNNTALFHQYTVFHNFCAGSLQQINIDVPPVSEEIIESIMQYNKDRSSKLEKEVCAELFTSLKCLGNINITTSQYIPEIAANVDIIIAKGDKAQLFQVDGIFHYFWDDKQKRLLLDGSTILNTKLLEISGYSVSRISYLEWNANREMVIENIKNKLLPNERLDRGEASWVMVTNRSRGLLETLPHQCQHIFRS